MKQWLTFRMIYILDILNRHGTMNYNGLSLESKTYEAHIYNMVKVLKKRGFVTINKKGKCVFVSLTDKGKAMSEICSALLIQMKK